MENFSLPTPPGGLPPPSRPSTRSSGCATLSDVVLMNHDPELTKFQTEAFPAMPKPLLSASNGKH